MLRPKISVVTTVYNKEQTVSACMNSILSQDYEDLELIVVDDGSTDGSARRIESIEDGRIRTLRINHSGHSRAKNRGANNAKGVILYFIDADCVADRECLGRLKMDFDQSDVGCVGGELRALNENHVIPRAIDIWHNPPPQPPGGNVAYSREAFEKAGGFDETIEYGEDVDLYWRVKALGFKCSIDTTIKARTLHPETVLSFFEQRFQWGMGYAQLTQRHAEMLDSEIGGKELQTSFPLFSVTLLSCVLMLIDLRLVIIFLVLDFAIVARYAHPRQIISALPLGYRTRGRIGGT
jgi:glycosyltransferase involved in cell wall biosynthesis